MSDEKKKKKKEKGPRRPLQAMGLDMGLCVLSGVLWFTACAAIDIWPFAWFATVPLMWVIHDKRPRKAFWYAQLAGFVANFGGFYWITGTLERFAGLPLVVSLLGTSLLAFYQALVFGIWGAATVAILRRKNLGMTFIAPLVFVAAELLLPMEFPYYVAITQAWVRPVIQIADLVGPLGVTFLLLMTSGAIFDLFMAWRQKRKLPLRRAAIAGGVLVFSIVYGFIQMSRWDAKMDKAPKIKVGVIQANIGIRVKGKAAFAVAQLGLHHQLSLELQRLGADLIVWPESTHPFPMSRDKRSWGRDFFSLLTRRGPDVLYKRMKEDQIGNDPRLVKVPMLVGVQTNHWGKGRKVGGKKRPEKIYNSAALIDSSGRIETIYDKLSLVMFSERIPLHDLLVKIDFFKQQFRRRRMSHFTPGDRAKVFRFGRYRIGAMICFEDILQGVGRKIAAEKPNLFVNITNDAWFGASTEPYQHMALAVFRTIEHRRPMVRAVNTGTSAYIDATGRITLQAPAVEPRPQPPDVKDPTPHVAHAGLKKVKPGLWRSPVWPFPYVLLGTVAMVEPTTTVYAAIGWLFGWGCLFIVLYLLFIWKRGIGSKLFRFRGEPMQVQDKKARKAAREEEEKEAKAKEEKKKGKGSGKTSKSKKSGKGKGKPKGGKRKP